MCGVLALLGKENICSQALLGLWALHHRGQDACGLTLFNQTSNRFQTHKGQGNVANVLSENVVRNLEGQWALGHTRYPTAGGDDQSNILPILSSAGGGIAISFNGNISNYPELKIQWQKKGAYFASTSDSEVILKYLTQSLVPPVHGFWEQLKTNIQFLFREALGGMAVAGLAAGHGMFAFRDPWGLRPLFWGYRHDRQLFAVASETSALDLYELDQIEELGPGECLFISSEGKIQRHQLIKHEFSPCMFEWVYFSNPQSQLQNQSVFSTRLKLGEYLARKIKRLASKHKWTYDHVVPIPDSGRIAATAVAEHLGIPMREALIKNRYIQRSFIGPNQIWRQRALQLKLAPVKELIEGKELILIDDSIVRGSTARTISKLLRQFGAKRITLAVTCPPVRHPCYFGIDFPKIEELVAPKTTNHRQLAELMELDEVIYLDLEDLACAIPCSSFCQGCLTGQYPIKDPTQNHSIVDDIKGPINESNESGLPIWQ